MNPLGRLGLFLLTGLLVACAQAPGASPTPSPSPAPSPTATPSAPAGLAGRQFLSLSVALAGADFPLVPNTRIRLSFDDSSLSANVGCNTIGGNYSIDADRIVFSGGQMTEMACDQARMSQDDWLAAILSASPRFTLVGDALTLFSGDTVIDLLDREVAEPDQPLIGPTWTLTSLISGGAVSSVPVGVTASLVFHADGTFGMNDGCNSGGGKYFVDGEAIRFAEVVTTDMACGGAAGQVEQAVLAVLNADAITFAIDAYSLTVMAGNIGLQLSNAPVAQ